MTLQHIFEGKNGKVTVEQNGKQFSIKGKINITPFYSTPEWGLGIYPKGSVSEGLQSQIKAEIKRQFDCFVESLQADNSLKAIEIGYDVIEYVIAPSVDTKENRFFLEVILSKTGGSSFMAKAALKSGEDVTPMVLARWQKFTGSTPVATAPITFECYECGHLYTENQAKRLVASSEGAWEGHTGFYCGC